MPDRRHFHKNTEAYPLWNNGCVTWNKKTRQLIFMNAGQPTSPREELRKPTSFYVEGDDIKRLYQILHAHFMEPRNITRSWDPSLPVPPGGYRKK